MMTKDPFVPPQLPVNKGTVHRVVFPFKDQTSADEVIKQLFDLSKKTDHTLQPVFKSRNICEVLKMGEPKPPLIKQQCVVFNYQCDLCDAEYVGHTCRHLQQRVCSKRTRNILCRTVNYFILNDVNSNYTITGGF